MANRAALIAEILHHLEKMDGDDLHSQVHPPEPVGVEITELKPEDKKEKGPLEELASKEEEKDEPGEKSDEDEPTDEELKELMGSLK